MRVRVISLILMLAAALLPAAAAADSLYMDAYPDPLSQPPLPPKTVILTFDDGPSDYTPKILKILQAKHVHATFFVVGREALAHPLLKQMYEQGNEIGNHTYNHPDLSQLADWRIRQELNLDNLVIESQTQRSSRLFRPPFLGSDSLSLQSEDLIRKADEWGYVTAGEDIDSEDWRKPGAAQIIKNTTLAADGGIILLHDGGGDRYQTVEALPGIIDYYQARGYKFAMISEALGWQRQAVMPALGPGDVIWSGLAGGVFGAYHLATTALYWIVLILIIASFGRMTFVVLAALAQARRTAPEPPATDIPCSILVPAYNEAAVIEPCLRSILASDYASFEVIVIDDGSKDDTAPLARQIRDPRLHVVTKPNGGKASALNHGINLARTNFVIAIDADTVFKADTLRQLMRHFQNSKVGAVSGNTRIANRHNLLTKLQSLEYVIGFNLDRRMGDLFDCITVVPGAIGAFRKSALAEVGGFTFDTLAEDTDLTLAIKRNGWKIVYDAAAMAYTEAPATVAELLKQRFRWTFGTMQAVYKHRQALLNPRYGTLGLIGLPFLLFYQILFPLAGPLFDAAMIWGLLTHQYHLMLISLAIYTAADVLMSAIALRLDGVSLTQLWLIIPQRILYRQLMYYVIAKSALNVMRGNLVGWGSLKREGKHLSEVSTA